MVKMHLESHIKPAVELSLRIAQRNLILLYLIFAKTSACLPRLELITMTENVRSKSYKKSASSSAGLKDLELLSPIINPT